MRSTLQAAVANVTICLLLLQVAFTHLPPTGNNAPHCMAISARIGATQRVPQSVALEHRVLGAVAVVSSQLQRAATARVLSCFDSIAFLKVIFGSTSGSAARCRCSLHFPFPWSQPGDCGAGLASFACSVASKRKAPLIQFGPGIGSNAPNPSV